MGTPPTPFGTGQLHEVFPSALGLLLRANIGTDDAAVLQVQFDVGINQLIDEAKHTKMKTYTAEEYKEKNKQKKNKKNKYLN